MLVHQRVETLKFHVARIYTELVSSVLFSTSEPFKGTMGLPADIKHPLNGELYISHIYIYNYVEIPLLNHGFWGLFCCFIWGGKGLI